MRFEYTIMCPMKLKQCNTDHAKWQPVWSAKQFGVKDTDDDRCIRGVDVLDSVTLVWKAL